MIICFACLALPVLSQGTSLSYDGLSRLTQIIYDNETVIVYEYDTSGNILSKRSSFNADPDADGVVNSADNCPFTVNAQQFDNDADNLGDACDPDDDNDGLSDTDELEFNTNPLSSDSDGDEVSDGTEIMFGSDPNNRESSPETLIQLIASISLREGINLIGTIENQFFVRSVADWIEKMGGEGAVTNVALVNPLTGSEESCGYANGSLEGLACGAPLKPGIGWFVRSETEQVVSVDAPVDCQPIDLVPGPNLVSFPCLSGSLSAFEFLTQFALSNDVSAIETLNGLNAHWTSAAANDSAVVGTDFGLSPTRSYLIHTNSTSSLNLAQ